MDESDFGDFSDVGDFISRASIAILGLGLMGGSLAMALRGKCARILGIDKDPQALALAGEWGIADEVGADAMELLPQADVIILATPVRTILTILEELPALHPGPAVVIDLGSTKVRIVEAMAGLPERFDPLGGHPMCGKERSSLANAEAGLYQGAPFAFTPLARTSSHAQALAAQIAREVGAEPLWLDPATHDHWVGMTSHLPYLVANCLAGVTPSQAAPMAGPGLRSTTRLAPSPLNMMLDILMTNRDNLLAGVQSLQERLRAIEACLAAGDETRLSELLAQGAQNYEALTRKSKVV